MGERWWPANNCVLERTQCKNDVDVCLKILANIYVIFWVYRKGNNVTSYRTNGIPLHYFHEYRNNSEGCLPRSHENIN